MTKLERSNCEQTEKLQLCKTKKKFNCDNSKTQIGKVIKITVVTEVVIMTSLSKNTLTPWQPTNSQGSFSQLLRCFIYTYITRAETEGTNHGLFRQLNTFKTVSQSVSQSVMSKPWTSHDQAISKSWESHEQAMSKSWARYEQVMSNSWASKSKSWVSPEQVMSKSWVGSHPALVATATATAWNSLIIRFASSTVTIFLP